MAAKGNKDNLIDAYVSLVHYMLPEDCQKLPSGGLIIPIF
jgi:hypothetical protein